MALHTFLLVSTIALLTCLAPSTALAAVEETHVFDPTLSLTGDCSTATVDTVPDPGTCPIPPGVPGVDHPNAAFKVPKGVAVDAYGNRYVASYGPEEAKPNQGRIDIFGPSGKFITEIADTNGPRALAVDAAGNLYVHERINSESSGSIVRYPPSEYEPKTGQIKYSLPPVVVFSDLNSNGQIALDRSTGRLFYQRTTVVFEFGSAAEGNPLLDETIGKGQLTKEGATGFSAVIAIDAAHQRIYDDAAVEGKGNVIKVFDLKAPHELLGTIDGSTTPAGEFQSTPFGIAVEESTGHIFVGDTTVAKKVYELEANGSYVSTIKPSAGSFVLIGYPQMVVDNSPKSPNRGYLYVPSSEGTPGRSFAFKPLHPVTANEFALTVKKQGGEGTVVSAPAGISCATACSEQSAKFVEGEVITLTATPAEGASFAGWSGSGCSGTGTCEVTMSEAKSVTAEFKAKEALPTHTLTVTVTGNGSVSADKGTISGCTSSGGPSCEGEYEEGSKVLLTETPGPHSRFGAWQTLQCDESPAATCQVTIGAGDEGVGAGFIDTFALKVQKTGTGTGKVTSAPAGIDCGSTCEAEYDTGTEVTLTQEASAGSEFVKWSGACTGSGACEVTMSEAREVGAEFKLSAKPKFALKVKTTGTGSGKVTGPGIDCGSTCEAEYEEGTKVTLTQAANPGSKFTEWSGACTGTGTCEVTMSAAKEVTAKFDLVPKFKLSVTKSGTGAGTVTSTPAGISCGAICSAEYESGAEVELKESPEAGSEFKEWSGACSGSGSCKVTMSEARSVGAKFDLVAKPKFLLKVKTTGTGTGKVTGPGIDCGTTCEAEFEEGTKVTLAQAASPGSKFTEWSGACTGTGTCEVTMSEAKSVTAEFKLLPKPKFKLSVSKTGAGAGTVTSSPAGINCGVTCSFEFEEGKEVELKESPEAGSEFVKWSGACSGSGTCKVTMTEAKSVTAEFKLSAKPKFALKVKTTGTGSGKVTGPGIDCGSTCEAEYEERTKVTLTQSASPGSKFTEWSGACTGSGACEVTMSAAKEVTAKFDLVPKFKLSVSKTGTGAGTVTSSPAGINCGVTCSFEYEEGKVVELKPLASTGSRFTEWSGACTGTGTCKVTMSAAKAVAARFDLVPKFKLTVSKTGTGAGTVTSTPAGISCGSTCEAEFEEGKEVELTAAPDEGSEFVKWSGACKGAGSCKVTMSAAQSVTAVFKALPTARLLIQKSGTGAGRVRSAPPISAIDCGSICEAKLPLGAEVELIATPDPGSEFFKWSGACNGTGPCKVTMDSAKTAHATFKALPSFKLSVTKTGPGAVIGSPAGIDCGSQCEHEYAAGTAVTLSATAAAGYRLKGWGGCDNAGGATCTLTLHSPRTVTATFVLAKCKKGFRKAKVKGKSRCVRTKRHASHRRGARNSLALPAFWP